MCKPIQIRLLIVLIAGLFVAVINVEDCQEAVLELLSLFFQTMKVYDFILCIFFLLARQLYECVLKCSLSFLGYTNQENNQYGMRGPATFYRILGRASAGKNELGTVLLVESVLLKS